jgi:hypothetical protein
MDAARRVKRASNEGYFSSWASGFFAPLTVFAPVAHKGGVTPQKSLKKDWSLTWLAFSFAPDSLVMGGIQYSLQYAAGKYNWTGEMVRLSPLASSLPILSYAFADWILHKRRCGYSSALSGSRTARLVQLRCHAVHYNTYHIDQLFCASSLPKDLPCSSQYSPESPSTRDPNHPHSQHGRIRVLRYMRTNTHRRSTLASRKPRWRSMRYPSCLSQFPRTRLVLLLRACSPRSALAMGRWYRVSRWSFMRSAVGRRQRRDVCSAQ